MCAVLRMKMCTQPMLVVRPRSSCRRCRHMSLCWLWRTPISLWQRRLMVTTMREWVIFNWNSLFYCCNSYCGARCVHSMHACQPRTPKKNRNIKYKSLNPIWERERETKIKIIESVALEIPHRFHFSFVSGESQKFSIMWSLSIKCVACLGHLW